MEILSNSVGGALVPSFADFCLLGGEDIYESAAKGVEFIGFLDVAVKGCGIELGEEVNSVVAGVEAVTDGDVDEPVFSS